MPPKRSFGARAGAIGARRAAYSRNSAPAAAFPGLENIIAEPAASARPVWSEKKRSNDRKTKIIFAGGMALVVILLFVVFIIVMVNT